MENSKHSLFTLFGQYEAETKSVMRAFWVGVGLLVIMTLLIFFLLYKLWGKEVHYVTLNGVERSGFVSESTARSFVNDYLKWYHNFSYNNITERLPYITSLTCTASSNYYLPVLKKEEAFVLKNKVVQEGEILELKLVSKQSNAFVFQASIVRRSQMLNVNQKRHSEVFLVKVHHTDNLDGTKQLCVSANKLIS